MNLTAQGQGGLPPGARRNAKPSLVSGLLFLGLLSGPPKLRFRDPQASLYGEMDFAAIFQVAVWALAGIWVLSQLRDHLSGKEQRLQIWLSQKLGLLLILCLGASTFVSLAPLLTAFKVYQLLILFLFGLIFVQRYGAQACFDGLLLGNILLCVAIVISLWVAPDLVVFVSETGAPRLRGSGIAETGIVGAFATILLLTSTRRIAKSISLILLGFLTTLVFFSLMRTSYLVLAVFFALALLKRPQSKTLRWLVILASAAVLIALIAGVVPDLSEYRDPESFWTLSDRFGLWAHFIDTTLAESPWIGLGYFSATRVLGMEYNPLLGSGHSVFFEVFVGGGLLSLALFLWLVLLLFLDASWLLFRKSDSVSFTAASLFLAVLLFGLIGAELDSGQVGFTFWLLVTMLPYLRSRGLETEKRAVKFRRALISYESNA